MAWNEPGGNNRDPWSGGSRDQGPPDLDEVIRKLSAKFGGLLGGKRGDETGGARPTGFWVIVIIVLLGWLVSGFYIVDEGTRGVELRFGRYINTTLPGLNYRLPFPIESVKVVDVEQRRFEEIGYRSGDRQGALRSVPKEALMLTQDENIVDIRLSVQYQIKDPRAYLFNVVDPIATLRVVVESAVRETIGKSTMDFVLTEGRSNVVADVQQLTQAILDQYGAGLQVTNVNLQDAQPPEEVQDSFADAIKAREDEQRLKNEAEAYANEIIPKARGQGARRLEEAAAYKDQVIAQAEGEASRFEQLLTEYERAPEVTRERLYLDTLESIFANVSKVLVDVTSSNNLFYLPLDKLIRRGDRDGGAPVNAPELATEPLPPAAADTTGRSRESGRSRETR